VIVSDDGQEYVAESFCRQFYPWVRYTKGLQKGPAANRNNGAKLAIGDWLVFTDDDCLPDSGWLKAYAEAIQQYPECKAFEGAILPDDWNLLKKDMAECPVNTEGGCFWSANIMVKKELFFNIGGFDKEYIIAAREDQDLFYRLQGLTNIMFCKNVIVTHPVRFISFSKRMHMLKSRSENYLYFAQKNHRSLGFTSKKEIIFKGGIMAQLRALNKNLKSLKLKSSLINMYAIIAIYMPVYIKCFFSNETYS